MHNECYSFYFFHEIFFPVDFPYHFLLKDEFNNERYMEISKS